MWLIKKNISLNEIKHFINLQFYEDIIVNKDINKLFFQNYLDQLIFEFPSQFVNNDLDTDKYVFTSNKNQFTLDYNIKSFNRKNYRLLTKSEIKSLNLPIFSNKDLENLFDFKDKNNNSVTVIYPNPCSNKFEIYDKDSNLIQLNRLNPNSQNLLKLIMNNNYG